MALKKSQLYSSLWSSCDELRGGMDASQYKDYVLTLLFMKYVSDKGAHDPKAVIEVPPGGGFEDMVRLKGDKEIGKLADANDLCRSEHRLSQDNIHEEEQAIIGWFQGTLPKGRTFEFVREIQGTFT